jgi:DNA-binding IclR family transcriptional regulator
MIPQGNPGVRLALKILSLLSSGSQSFSELATSLDNPTAATLSRNLKVLIEEGWIIKGEDQRYHEGRELSRSACSLVSRKTGTPQLIPLIENLAEESGQSAAFARWQGKGIVFTAKKEMADSFHYIPLGKINTHNSYNGFNITCLAFLPHGREVVAAPPTLDSLFTHEDEIETCFEKIRREKSFFCHDTVMRFTAPVFYEGVGDNPPLAGVMGISLIPRELSREEKERYLTLVKSAAEKAGKYLLGEIQ